MTLRLVTIPISHYCEKARWALERAGLAFVEDGHVPLWHWRAAFAVKGTRTVPILVHEAGAETDSTDILHYVDARTAPELRLFPEDPTQRAEVEQWEERFDRSLGPHSRRWAYFHLLPDRDLALATVAQGAPKMEAVLTGALFPLYAALLRRGLNITPQKSTESLEKLHKLFAEVSEVLADGRPYLCAGRFTAADLTFASLAAPALLPDHHPGFVVPWERVPAAMRTEVEKLRATPAGQFVLRMYAEERGKKA